VLVPLPFQQRPAHHLCVHGSRPYTDEWLYHSFFGKYLKGLNGYDAYLRANHNPDELIVKAAP
jgi:hypothetical protein